MKLGEPYIIFTGTNPDSAKGGIGVVLAGYFAAVEYAQYDYECIPTYHPATLEGKWRPWLTAFPALFALIRRINREGKQSIVYSHAGEGVSLLRESCILWAAKAAGAKTIMQIHSCKVDTYLARSVQRLLLRLAFVPADTVCVLTNWWKHRLESAGVNARIRVIPNPLPSDLLKTAQLEREACTACNPVTVTVLSMARLVSGKGVDVMIQAMAELPEHVHLVVAGDGDQRESLKRLAREMRVAGRVRFVGWVSGEEKVRLLEEADLFCLPSTYDAFPMSMVEAMAHGLPVVAVKWGGIPDMVADGRVGILADEPRPAAIAEAVGRLLDKDRRLEMGREAKRWVLEISEPERVGERLKELIEELIA